MRKLIFIFTILIPTMAKAEFFSNISDIIENNNDRLSYGVSVTDFNKDGTFVMDAEGNQIGKELLIRKATG